MKERQYQSEFQNIDFRAHSHPHGFDFQIPFAEPEA
jgi:hypothetical protein